MIEEIKALEETGSWTIEILQLRKKPIGCKWVFKIKWHLDRTIERFNERLVVKGNTQVEGLDFHETFAPITKLSQYDTC